jgi:hypothetical protein
VRENFEPNWPTDNSGPAEGAWIRIPAPPPVPKTNTIWHYTNTTGLIGILQSDRVWATAVSMLNDSTELRYGLDMAESSYQEFTQSQDLHDQQHRFLAEVASAAKSALRTNAIYAVCASQDGDDLGQWRGYAEGSGYAIGLKAVPLSGVCGVDQEPAEWQHRDLHAGWQQVLYDPEDQTKLLIELWEFAAAITPGPDHQPDDPEWQVMLDTATSAVTNAVALMKHPGFRGEREVRFAFDATRHRRRNLQKFRSGPHGVTPYVELGMMPERSPSYLITTHSPDRLKVSEVKIGPAQDQQTAELGLKTLLGTLGRVHTASVSHSAVPYR